MAYKTDETQQELPVCTNKDEVVCTSSVSPGGLNTHIKQS